MRTRSRRHSPLMQKLWTTTILAGLASPGLSLAADPPSTAAVQVASTAPTISVAQAGGDTSVRAPQGDTTSTNAQSSASTTGNNPTALPEVIVTATHSAQSVQRVPISIQALTAETLAEHHVEGLSDLTTLLPSVSIAGLGPGRNTLYFRGIVPAGGNYASVGYYLDDIPITGTSSPEIHPYDIQRIEALSGPQGTLYGAGSLSGTVRFITNKPVLDKFEGGYDVEGNKYGGGDGGGLAQGYANLPVTSNSALRLMAYYRHDGGYINNTPNDGKFNNGQPAVLNLGDDVPSTYYDLNNSNIAKNAYNPINEYGGRIIGLWEPVRGWTVTPEFTAQRQIADGSFGYDPRVGDLDVHDYSPTRNDDAWLQAQVAVHGHIADFDLVSATGYFNRTTKIRNDYTYYTVTYDSFGAGQENYLQFFDKNGCTGSGAALKCNTLINPTQDYHALDNQQKFTQEVRITTPTSWPFDMTVGAFYQWQLFENNGFYAIPGLNNIEGYTEAGGQESNPAGFGIPVQNGGTMVLGSPAVAQDGFYVVQTNLTDHDEAFFTELHYNILPNLKFTGGVRYFFTDAENVGFAGVAGSAESTTTSLYVPTGTYGCPIPINQRLSCLNTNFAAKDEVQRYSENGETHKLALNWQIDPTKMVYLNYSTGFRPGGSNRPLRIRDYGVATVAPYLSETLTNYEVGLKTTWARIFRFNAAAYIEDWDNVQYGVVVAGAQGAGITGNAGNARVYGAEFDSDLRLGKFTLSTSGSYNDARLSENFCNFALNTSTGSIGQLSSCTPGAFVPNASPATPEVAAAAGTRLPRQPLFKGDSTIRYDTTFGPYGAYLQGTSLYQTGATQNLNTYYDSLLGDTPGFVSFDFVTGVTRNNWKAELFIENAFDKRGELTKNTFCSIVFCSNSSRTYPIQPQFIGVRFSQIFK